MIKLILSALHGKRALSLPTIAFVDCADLVATLSNLRPASDKMLMEDIVSLRSILAEQKLVHEIRKIPGHFNLADVLTKPTANSEMMRKCLITGSVKGIIDGSLEVKPSPGLMKKQWVALATPPKDPSWHVNSDFITLSQPGGEGNI